MGATKGPDPKVVAACLLFGLGIFLLAQCDQGLIFTCRKQVLRHIPAPDGKYEALFVRAECGATTRGVFWITVKKPRARGIGHLVAVTESVPDIRWSAPRTLRLTPRSGPIFPESLAWRKIRVDLVNGGKYGTPGEHMVEWNGSYEDPQPSGLNQADAQPH